MYRPYNDPEGAQRAPVPPASLPPPHQPLAASSASAAAVTVPPPASALPNLPPPPPPPPPAAVGTSSTAAGTGPGSGQVASSTSASANPSSSQRQPRRQSVGSALSRDSYDGPAVSPTASAQTLASFAYSSSSHHNSNHVHNPYPPASSTRDNLPIRGPTSAVLAALASSDLEYPGIMPPDPGHGVRRASSDYGRREHRPLVPSYQGASSYELPPPNGRPPWEQGYQDRRHSQPQVQPPTGPSTGPDSDSPAPPKKRRRKQGGSNDDIPEGAEVEYADPEGDTSRGPVFVHPPKDAVQACVRCHRIKRKCDGAFPRCVSCTRADVPCVFELSPATSNYVHKLKQSNAGLNGDLSSAHARIRALEDQLVRMSAAAPQAPNAAHNSDSSGASEFGRTAGLALAMKEHAMLGFVDGRRAGRPRSPSPPPSLLNEIITHQAACSAVKTYFDFNQLSYPFMNRRDILCDLDDMFGITSERSSQTEQRRKRRATSSAASDISDENERRRFHVCMVLAIGIHSSERAGDPNRPSTGVPERLYKAALKYRPKSLEREDIICVQSLCLQALWTLANPASGSIWQIVGLASRVITSIGLHRRAEPTMPPAICEQRRRIFYAFYNIDRILAPTMCKPLSIAETDIDIELPTEQPEDVEDLFRGRPTIRLTRHVIRYRRLMGNILVQLYSVNGPQNLLPEPERLKIIRALHTDLDQWIVDCPPPGKLGPDTPKANYANWWQINYNHGLCTLYRPSPLYPETTPETLRALYDASSRCVDLYLEMYTINKTSFHLLQIIALFVSCISLLCCLCECDARMRGSVNDPHAGRTLAELGLGRYTGADDPAWAAEIRSRVTQCHNLFDAFGHHIPASAKYRDTFFRISELLLARYGPLDQGTAQSDVPDEGTDVGESQGDMPMNSAPPAVATGPIPPVGSVGSGAVSQAAQSAALLQNGVQPQPLTAEPGTVDEKPAQQLPGADDMAGAWDAMTHLWFDLGDLFGEDIDPLATLDDTWAAEWGQPSVSSAWGDQMV